MTRFKNIKVLDTSNEENIDITSIETAQKWNKWELFTYIEDLSNCLKGVLPGVPCSV